MLEPGDSLELTRDVDAFLIPSGTPVMLNAGENVTITQALGASYTIHVQGNLLRIHAKDSDALGLDQQEVFASHKKEIVPGIEVEEEQIWEKLRTCYDPEIPVNIADLGLIYTVELRKQKDDGYIIYIEMTLTAPGCGMGPILVQDIYDAVMSVINVVHVDIEMVFDPPWDQSMMTEAAQLQLGML